MNLKKQSLLPVFTFLFFLSSLSAFAAKPKNKEMISVPVVVLPEIRTELPSENFRLEESLLLSGELLPIDHVAITQDFTGRDQYEVKVTDPKLFTLDDKIRMNLAALSPVEYSFPLPGAKMISGYAGSRPDHAGVDLKTTSKDSVLAVFDGIVRISRSQSGYGNVIVIRHYNGLETLYSHNSKNLVKTGDRVTAGQPIALTGRTGRASTDHLHFETRINGQHFDPALLFDMQTGQLQPATLVFKKEGEKVRIESQEVTPSYHYSYIPTE